MGVQKNNYLFGVNHEAEGIMGEFMGMSVSTEGLDTVLASAEPQEEEEEEEEGLGSRVDEEEEDSAFASCSCDAIIYDI